VKLAITIGYMEHFTNVLSTNGDALSIHPKKRTQKGQPLCGTGLFGLSSFFQDAQNTAGDDAPDFPAYLGHQIFCESVHRGIAGTARSFLLG